MTITVGTNPALQSIINQSVASALKLPAGMPGSESNSPNPTGPVAQQTAPFSPPLGLAVAPSAEIAAPIPNVSQAQTDAVNAVEVPNFEEKTDELGNNGDNSDSGESDNSSSGTSDSDDSDLPDTPAAENFKKLRNAIKETRAAKREIEEQLTKVSNKLEKYEKGEVMPEVLSAKDQRIAELEPYEKIVNLKMSPEYQKEYVEPSIRLGGELDKIAESYGIPKEHLRQAVGIDNPRELNSWLSRNFDAVGALEVKKVINELHTLAERAIEAEKEPGMALQTLKAQYAEHQVKEAQTRVNVFENTAKDAWNAALEKTAKEGVYKEFILSQTNPEFNKTIVEPIQQAAAVQYGALIKKLYKAGAKELDPEFAAGLARMVILSIGGAEVFKAKNKAERTATEVTQHATRVNPYIRPSLGGSNGSGHNNKASDNTGPKTPQEAALIAARRFSS